MIDIHVETYNGSFGGLPRFCVAIWTKTSQSEFWIGSPSLQAGLVVDFQVDNETRIQQGTQVIWSRSGNTWVGS